MAKLKILIIINSFFEFEKLGTIIQKINKLNGITYKDAYLLIEKDEWGDTQITIYQDMLGTDEEYHKRIEVIDYLTTITNNEVKTPTTNLHRKMQSGDI